MHKFLKNYLKEWLVISRAPVTFFSALFAAVLVSSYLIYQYGFRDILEMKNDLINSYQQRIALLLVPGPTPQAESNCRPTKSEKSNHVIEEPAEDVGLSLQFSDERTIPKEIRQSNVRFWRALFTPSLSIKDDKGIKLFSVPPNWIVFVYFERPASYRQMFANCSVKGLECTVHESNNQFAIVIIAGDASLARLEVSVSG